MTDDNQHGYQCQGCDQEHSFGAYAIAQMAMGERVIHKCPCGMVNEFEDGELIHWSTEAMEDAT